MELTTRDLGVRVEEYTIRNEFHAYAVDGLPDGAKAMIFERDGIFHAIRLNVNVPVGRVSRRHDSMESALDELRQLLST